MSLEKSKRQKPHKWVTDEGWHDLVKLSELLPELFGSVLDDITQNENIWRVVCSSAIFVEFL